MGENPAETQLAHQHTPPSGLPTNGEKPQHTAQIKSKAFQFKLPSVEDQTAAAQNFAFRRCWPPPTTFADHLHRRRLSN